MNHQQILCNILLFIDNPFHLYTQLSRVCKFWYQNIHNPSFWLQYSQQQHQFPYSIIINYIISQWKIKPTILLSVDSCHVKYFFNYSQHQWNQLLKQTLQTDNSTLLQEYLSSNHASHFGTLCDEILNLQTPFIYESKNYSWESNFQMIPIQLEDSKLIYQLKKQVKVISQHSPSLLSLDYIDTVVFPLYPKQQPTTTIHAKNYLQQWVSSVMECTSQHVQYPIQNIIGSSNQVDRLCYGTQQHYDSITLKFEIPVYITQVQCFAMEPSNATIYRIAMYNEDTMQFDTIYQQQSNSTTTTTTVFTITTPIVYKSNKIRIELESHSIPHLIDAIQIMGYTNYYDYMMNYKGEEIQNGTEWNSLTRGLKQSCRFLMDNEMIQPIHYYNGLLCFVLQSNNNNNSNLELLSWIHNHLHTSDSYMVTSSDSSSSTTTTLSQQQQQTAVISEEDTPQQQVIKIIIAQGQSKGTCLFSKEFSSMEYILHVQMCSFEEKQSILILFKNISTITYHVHIYSIIDEIIIYQKELTELTNNNSVNQWMVMTSHWNRPHLMIMDQYKIHSYSLLTQCYQYTCIEEPNNSTIICMNHYHNEYLAFASQHQCICIYSLLTTTPQFLYQIQLSLIPCQIQFVSLDYLLVAYFDTFDLDLICKKEATRIHLQDYFSITMPCQKNLLYDKQYHLFLYGIHGWNQFVYGTLFEQRMRIRYPPHSKLFTWQSQQSQQQSQQVSNTNSCSIL